MFVRRAVTVVVSVGVLISCLSAGAPPALAFTEGPSNNFFGTGAGDDPANTGAHNSFFGGSAGTANTSGCCNAFFGTAAGAANTTACCNAFFGYSSGFSNSTGQENAFFGSQAGASNTTAGSNSFFGSGAGENNTTEGFNSFFGSNAGTDNTTCCNAFFGSDAGRSNTNGPANSFFGVNAGTLNTTGSSNAFFGHAAGLLNTTGVSNAFFGRDAGSSNTIGSANVFSGYQAGFFNSSGANNAFFGRGAGLSNTAENANSFLGALSDGLAGITNATAVGHQAQVNQSNSLVLGSINGLNDATSDVKVGVGTATPSKALHIRRTDGTVELLVEESSSTTANRTLFELTNNGAPRFLFNDTSAGGVDWQFSKLSNHNFTISDLGDGGAEMILQPNGVLRVGDSGVFDLVLDAAGNLSIAGTLTESSDRDKKTDISPANASKLLRALRTLDISTWRYKRDGLTHLGPMAQDFHQLFGLGTDTSISPKDVAALALVVAQVLDEQLQEERASNADLEDRVHRLERLT